MREFTGFKDSKRNKIFEGDWLIFGEYGDRRALVRWNKKVGAWFIGTERRMDDFLSNLVLEYKKIITVEE